MIDFFNGDAQQVFNMKNRYDYSHVISMRGDRMAELVYALVGIGVIVSVEWKKLIPKSD